MIVGENSRTDDIDVNPTKEKKLTNHRAAGSDDLVRLVPPRPMSLEQALEFIAADECVEVTPASVRLRKAVLDQTVRGRAQKNAAGPGTEFGTARTPVQRSVQPASLSSLHVGQTG